MTKKRAWRQKPPPARIEPELFRDVADYPKRRVARLRAYIKRYLSGERQPYQETVDTLLRRLLAGNDVHRFFSLEEIDKHDRNSRRDAAIATEHARLVMKLIQQGASEKAATKSATTAIVRELNKLKPYRKEADHKIVQRAVKSWPLHYRRPDGTTIIAPWLVVEKYEADLRALDAKKAPGLGKVI